MLHVVNTANSVIQTKQRSRPPGGSPPAQLIQLYFSFPRADSAGQAISASSRQEAAFDGRNRAFRVRACVGDQNSDGLRVSA
jgi:hypothetical protein